MLILTQDKCRIIKFKDIIDLFISYSNEPVIYCATLSNPFNNNYEYGNTLGKYTDKKRCKEVLIQILNWCESLNMYKNNDNCSYRVSPVFYMPEE